MFREITFGVISSLFLLTATVARHLWNTSGEAAAQGDMQKIGSVKNLVKQLYLDKSIIACKDRSETSYVYRVIKRVFN